MRRTMRPFPESGSGWRAPRSPLPKLRTLKRRGVATEQSIEPQNDIVEILLQSVRVKFGRAPPTLPILDALFGNIARDVTNKAEPSRAMNSPSLRLARRLDGSVGRPAPIREPPQLDFDFGSIFKRARGCTPIIRRRWARKHANREIEDVNFWLGGDGV